MQIANKYISNKRSQGFSLVEVLIAIIVISIGVFALASSQISLLKRGDSTMIENAIGMQASNLFEYMLANPDARAEYLGTYDMTTGAVNNHGTAASVIEDTTAWTSALFRVGATQAVVSQVGTTDTYQIVITYQNNGAWGKSNITTDITYITDVSLQR